ncbi:hypothetical protein EVAR_23682_1 [Eumeta japonica]|uniref:Uncharacterized protein n=1 Tax=Eumeta variegata TaxID=151549 RepID=A0A4C1VHQ5_EUMVA|nr:hypothetical protein EVAR_23682_1 [Eumeta japonica]
MPTFSLHRQISPMTPQYRDRNYTQWPSFMIIRQLKVCQILSLRFSHKDTYRRPYPAPDKHRKPPRYPGTLKKKSDAGAGGSRKRKAICRS